MKYRKKPIIVEAEVYKTGMEDGFMDQDDTPFIHTYPATHKKIPFINTLEGKLFIAKGDYIITGIKGERYPCNPDIFEATYEKVGEWELK